MIKTAFRILGFIRSFELIFILSLLCNTLYSILSTITITVIHPILEVLFSTTNGQHASATTSNNLKDKFYHLISQLIVSDDYNSTLLKLCGFIVVIFTAKNIVKYLGSNLNTRLVEGMVKKMRDTLFSKIMGQSLVFYQNRASGDIMSLVSNEIGAMNGVISPLLSTLFREPVEIAFFLILLLSFSPFLTLIALGSSVCSLLLIRFSTTRLRRYAVRMQNAMSSFTAVLQESIYAIRIIKALSAEQTAIGRFKRQTHDYVRAAIKNQKTSDAVPAINEILAITALSAVLFMGGREVFAGTMKGEELMTFLFALFGIMSPINHITGIPSQIQRGLVAANRVFEIIDSQPTVQSGSETVDSFRHTLEARNLSFSYGNKLVLKDISIVLPKSKKIAFVGTSGGGKSTMTDLFIRLYDPTSGAILLDGKDIRQFTLESYHRLFGIVSQEAILFNDTIANNISFGAAQADRNTLEEAAKAAHAHNFILELPQGYETIVGDRGTKLSGGQRQRISIARALINRPEILIFDEATSALDSESEFLVQQAINTVLENRTAIIVAHRLSTIRDADVIYVFDDGNVVEYGSHDELIALNGIYKRLFTIQFSTKQDDAATSLTQNVT